MASPGAGGGLLRGGVASANAVTFYGQLVQPAWAASGKILVLWGLIAATVVAFWRVRPLAGALLLLYLAWVSFASALSFAMWRLNPQLLG